METFLPSGMTKIGRRSLIAILILGGAWYYYHAIQKEHDDRVELAEKAKTEFEALGIPSRGLLASTHKLSNTKCNTSEFIAVYSTNESPLDICKHFIEYFPENDWQQNQRCMIVEQGQGGTAQPFTYVVENATKREIQYKDSFSGACKNFCVNGHLAGNCHASRSDDDRSKESCPQRTAGQPTG